MAGVPVGNNGEWSDSSHVLQDEVLWQAQSVDMDDPGQRAKSALRWMGEGVASQFEQARDEALGYAVQNPRPWRIGVAVLLYALSALRDETVKRLSPLGPDEAMQRLDDDEQRRRIQRGM